MENKQELQKMRKNNMKIFSIYRSLSWDYLFFYTINFLFLVQVKNINPADIMLIDAFYSFFTIITQIPSNIVVEFLGRKNSIILANVLNCLYMIIIICSRNLYELILAEMISSLAFAIKGMADPSLLNESIPPSSSKGKIFAKINAKGASTYYILNAISTVLAGVLYSINPYIPILCSFSVIVIVVILSINFIEPIRKKKKKVNIKKQMQDLQSGLQYILKSERLKALILSCSLIGGLLLIISTYEVSLLEDLKISSTVLGIIFAFFSLISSYFSKRQEKFHSKYKNKSLTILAICIAICYIIAGIAGIVAQQYQIIVVVIIVAYIVKYACSGIYFNLIERYLSNFTNEKIDTKIFAVANFARGIMGMIIGIVASFLLNRMNIAYSMFVMGIFGVLIYSLMGKYMKERVGKNPEEYTEEEKKYDVLEMNQSSHASRDN